MDDENFLNLILKYCTFSVTETIKTMFTVVTNRELEVLLIEICKASNAKDAV